MSDPFLSDVENDITDIPSQFYRKMCDQMNEKQHIGSVAHQRFSFKRDYFRVHFVIHFRCITKLHSLSSLRCPIGQEILHMKNLESNWNQSLNKNKSAVLRFPTTHLWGQNRNGGSILVPVTFHDNNVLHTTKHFHRSSSGAGRQCII